MSCKKCPHHVRHGRVIPNDNKIEFKDRCGLRMKESKPTDCNHYPFTKGFDYTACAVYQEVFKSSGQRNDVVPTSDFQYSDKLAGSSITEMELL
jgi:hypothetical protein